MISWCECTGFLYLGRAVLLETAALAAVATANTRANQENQHEHHHKDDKSHDVHPDWRRLRVSQARECGSQSSQRRSVHRHGRALDAAEHYIRWGRRHKCFTIVCGDFNANIAEEDEADVIIFSRRRRVLGSDAMADVGDENQVVAVDEGKVVTRGYGDADAGMAAERTGVGRRRRFFWDRVFSFR